MDLTCGLFGMPWLWGLVLITILFLFLPRRKEKKQSNLEILDAKFAEGVLSVADYQERKAILREAEKK